MKRLFFISLLISAFCMTAMAQNPRKAEREERLQAYRVAVFTEVLRLTAEEAQGFWPVYNEYLDNRDRMQDDLRPGKQVEAMNDTEVEEEVRRHFEKRQRDLDLEKDLYQKLRKVLPLRKIVKIPNAEREFRESLVKKLQENRDRRLERRQGRN